MNYIFWTRNRILFKHCWDNLFTRAFCLPSYAVYAAWIQNKCIFSL